jgi:hypothetical protein
MKINRIQIMILISVAISLAIFTGLATAGAKADGPLNQLLQKLLQSIEDNHYASFIDDGTDEFKAGITKTMHEGLSSQLSPRMKRGYDLTYLGDLQQQGCRVHLWRLSFQDGGDDTLAKLVIKEGKVAGFWLQ